MSPIGTPAAQLLYRRGQLPKLNGFALISPVDARKQLYSGIRPTVLFT